MTTKQHTPTKMKKQRISFKSFFRLFSYSFILLFISVQANAQTYVIDNDYNDLTFNNSTRTLISGVNNTEGAVYKYPNITTIGPNTVYALLTLNSITGAVISNIDNDPILIKPEFTTPSSAGKIVYQLEFFNTDDDLPVFLHNYYASCWDIDGAPFEREFYEFGGYASYEIDALNVLDISTDPSTQRTSFLATSTGVNGWELTSSFIVNYSVPNNKITFSVGNNSETGISRLYYIKFGAEAGSFSEPETICNPIPLAIDDIGTTIDNSIGGISVNNVLLNDKICDAVVTLNEVNLQVITPASNSGVELNSANGEVTVAIGTPPGDYTITYEICLTETSICDQATVSVEVTEPIGSADLQITKSANPNPAIADHPLYYTITVKNNGPDEADNVEVIDILPSEVTFVNASPSTGTWSAPTWDVGNLANGDSATLILETSVVSGSIEITNTAIASSTTPDPDDCNNTATSSIDINTCACIINHFPEGFGTLAFEDLWPGKGDYDFNDLVMDYQFEITTNTSNYVQEVIGTFIIKAFGAGYENGFGFQLPGTIDKTVLDVTGYNLTENYIHLASNGFENNQSRPTIIVFDNSYNQMECPGGTGVNTDQYAPYVTPDTLRVVITFPENTYTYDELNISEFNPFLIINQNRGREVHLLDNPPTDLADISILGTYEDNSDIGSGKFYRTHNNLPWAINIYDSFDYPREKAPIDNAYNHFIEWAKSEGGSYSGWYRDLSGYRNSSSIYNQP